MTIDDKIDVYLAKLTVIHCLLSYNSFHCILLLVITMVSSAPFYHLKNRNEKQIHDFLTTQSIVSKYHL